MRPTKAPDSFARGASPACLTSDRAVANRVGSSVSARIAAAPTGVAIDDFGTGYSSLVYLKRYKLHALKVDRSFVAGLGVNADDDAIVASIVTLARAVGAVCIAEGVETPEQHGALLALGCDYAQGYLFGRPVPAAALRQSLADCASVLGMPPLPESPAE